MRNTPAQTADFDQTMSAIQLLRMSSVIRVTGLGRSTIYKLIAEAKFPSPVQLAGRTVAWRRTDIEHWTQARPPTTHCAPYGFRVFEPAPPAANRCHELWPAARSKADSSRMRRNGVATMAWSTGRDRQAVICSLSVALARR